MYESIPENPYLLLTPGPLSTSKGVRSALLRDWCTWDDDYNQEVVQKIRGKLTALASGNQEAYTAVLLQGSGSYGVEACLGTALPEEGKLLILANGAYGMRMVRFMEYMNRPWTLLPFDETEQTDPARVEEILKKDKRITHVAMVHCETTTGILNPLEEVCRLARQYGKTMIVDAMSSFGGIPMDLEKLGIDFLISSANKCIQGVPGFCFVIARKELLKQCRGNAHSYSLDLYDQWKEMDQTGKWRFTSPTHTVRAFLQALTELEEEGGIPARYKRYTANQHLLREGMESLGFQELLSREIQSPIITSFLYPSKDFNFGSFYQQMKERGFVLYPGKVSKRETFRIGNIGEIYPGDIENLLRNIKEVTA